MKTESSCSHWGSPISRREFARQASFGAAAVGAAAFGGTVRAAQQEANDAKVKIPLKIGHRAASMKMVGNFNVFKMARQIPGLIGVELQVAHGKPNLRDWDAVRRYKREANRWGMMIPSLAGLWDRGVSILDVEPAGKNIEQAVRVAEFLGASVILAAFFKSKAPDMTDESSYGPVVQMLQRVAPTAEKSGVTIGLENSLSPAHNKKLVDLVDHPAVKVYYDPHNMAHYGYGDQAVPGIKLLGRDRICQMHVKNGKKLIAEPGLVDWPAAFDALNEIQYDGWYVFESSHTSRAQAIEATTKNVKFLRKHCRMPAA